MTQEINVVSRTQIINVIPGTQTVSITNAGPMGPAGPEGPMGPGGPPGTITTQSEFDVEPPNWGAHFRAAVDDADTRLVEIVVPGDSLATGENSTNWREDGFVGLFTAELQAEFGDGGSGFIGAGWLTAGGAPITTVGSWDVVDDTGGLGRRCLKPSSPGNGATVSTVCRGTIVDVYLKTDTTFGTWQVKIDAGSFVNVPINTAGSIKKYTVTGLSAGDHVVTTKANSGDGRWYGHRGRNATGIIVDNVSVSGTMLSQLAQDTTGMAPTDPYKDTMIYKILETFAPVDLVVLPLGVNDVLLDVDDATWSNNLWNALSALDVALKEFGPTALTKRPDVLTLAHHVGNMEPIAGFGLFERDWVQILTILRTYSAATGASFVDMWARGGRSWDAWAVENVWAAGNTDPVHLNNHGHELVKDAIMSMLRVT